MLWGARGGGGVDIGGGIISLPRFPEYWTQTTGTWVGATASGPLSQGYIYNSTSALNDEIQASVYLSKGTYSLFFVYTKRTTGGIIDITVNGNVEINNLDLYAGSTSNRQVEEVTGVTIPSSGSYTIDIKVVSKNASSSSYRCDIEGVYFVRTG